MNQRLDADSELMIDGLRGIAALMVLFSHAFELVVAEVFGWDPNQTPDIWRFARASLGNGDFWVWCFFVISGLCIHRSIARSVQEGSFSWWRYAVARVTRIYPLFLLGFALAILGWLLGQEFSAVEVQTAPWPQMMSTVVNLQLLTSAFPNFGPSWSLTCEVVYYAVWPALLLLCGGRVRQTVLLNLAGSIFAIAGILVLWRVFHRFETSALMGGIFTISVLYPVWVAGAWLGGAGGSVTVSKRTWYIGFVICVLSFVLEWILRFKHYPVLERHFLSWGAIPGIVIVLAGAGHLQLSAKSWARPVCSWLGQFSYPCYILHIPLLVLINYAGDTLLPTFAAQHSCVLTVLETATTLLILVLIGPRLESFFMKWRAGLLKACRA